MHIHNVFIKRFDFGFWANNSRWTGRVGRLIAGRDAVAARARCGGAPSRRWISSAPAHAAAAAASRWRSPAAARSEELRCRRKLTASLHIPHTAAAGKLAVRSRVFINGIPRALARYSWPDTTFYTTFSTYVVRSTEEPHLGLRDCLMKPAWVNTPNRRRLRNKSLSIIIKIKYVLHKNAACI